MHTSLLDVDEVADRLHVTVRHVRAVPLRRGRIQAPSDIRVLLSHCPLPDIAGSPALQNDAGR